ncbi:MAG: hypothetical protein Q9160_005905 [Pyrenula sp. 1 TL-2023]
MSPSTSGTRCAAGALAAIVDADAYLAAWLPTETFEVIRDGMATLNTKQTIDVIFLGAECAPGAAGLPVIVERSIAVLLAVNINGNVNITVDAFFHDQTRGPGAAGPPVIVERSITLCTKGRLLAAKSKHHDKAKIAWYQYAAHLALGIWMEKWRITDMKSFLLEKNEENEDVYKDMEKSLQVEYHSRQSLASAFRCHQELSRTPTAAPPRRESPMASYKTMTQDCG